jgi:glycosyltransferase involved in cell wall biosynthesis
VPAGNRDITAVVACYDYGRYLPEAVGSLLSQEGGAPHVVVVDDGSTDPGTHRALDELPDEVEVVRQANAGVAAARNAGLAGLETDYAIVVDADDRLAPTALAELRAPLDADRERRHGFAYGSMRFFGAWSGVMRMPPYDPFKLLYRHTIGLSALMRRELVEDTGGFDPAIAEYEDWELWLNALAHGWRGVQVDAVTLEYRRHAGSKHSVDRTRYRAAYRQIRAKHAALYAGWRALAEESGIGAAGRLAYRGYWGPRPLPGRVENALYRVVFRGGRAA